jgi:hypothetical protein
MTAKCDQLQPNFLKRKLSPLGYEPPSTTVMHKSNYNAYAQHTQIT